MKLLVFSDIHGSVPAARQMLALAGHYSPDAIILLGDILYHGPRNPLPEGYMPKDAADCLAPLAPRLIALRGNCDSEVDCSVLPFPLSSGLSWVLYPSSRRAIRICATHGHLYNAGNLPPLQAGDVLLFGHTHIPVAETTPQGIHVCNPGSLSLPKEGYPSCYGLFEDGVFSVFTGTGGLYRQVDCN